MTTRRWAGVACVVVALASTASGKGDATTTAVSALIEAQFAGWSEAARTKAEPRTALYAPYAMVAMTGATVTPQVTKFTSLESKWALFGPASITRHAVRDVRVTVARDGRSAWVSFAAKVAIDGLNGAAKLDLRASQLLFKTETGWSVGSGAYSLGQPAKLIAKAARAGDLDALEPIMNSNVGERSVISAMESFVTAGLDDTARASKTLLAIGPAPGERTVGGKALAKSLATSWLGAATLDGAIWAVTAPSGTTACATVNVQLRRGAGDDTYVVPARAFVVFDKDATGAWSVAHVHLAVAGPSS